MPRYAKETTVPVEKSRAEIEQTLRRYNATEFHSGWKPDAAFIAFRIGDLFIRFVLPLPGREGVERGLIEWFTIPTETHPDA